MKKQNLMFFIRKVFAGSSLLLALFYGFVFFFSTMSTAVAQQGIRQNHSDKNVLFVQDAIRLAYEKNPALNRSKLILASAAHEKWIDFGLSPVRISYMKEGILSSTGKGFAEKRWAMMQSLDNPLKIYHRFKAGQKMQESAKEQLREMQLEIRKQVKTAYAEIAYSIRMLELQKQVVEIIQDFYQTAQIRYQSGEATLMDLLKAEIDLAEARNELDDAEQEYHKKRYALFTVIGIEAEEQSYEIRFPDTLRYVDIQVDQDSALNQISRMPSIASLTYTYESALSQKKAAWSGLLPDLDFSVYLQNYGTGYHHHGFEIGLSFPIGSIFENRASIALAGIRARTFQWHRREKELELKMHIENAWHRYDAVRRSLHRFQETIGSKSEQLYRMTSEAYRAGQSDILALLEARRTFINNQRKYYGLLLDYYRCVIELEPFFEKEFIFTHGE